MTAAHHAELANLLASAATGPLTAEQARRLAVLQAQCGPLL